jgi:outer membrane receptor protein involved in Fe transport
MAIPTSASAAPVETVVVTGTLIPTPNATSNSPIQTVSSEAIDLSGHPNVEQVINQLPQVVPGLGSFSNNPGGGEAVVDLRGLSPNRNLVLVDGRRAMPTQLTGEVDLNTIPASLIDHVDVVTGGGSATYGSDAISGVVNFVLKRDFEGFEGQVRYGQEVSNSFAPEKEINLTMGVNSGDGKANVTIFAEYYKRNGVLQGEDPRFLLDFGTGSATSDAGRVDASQGFPKLNRGGFGTGGPCDGTSSTYAFLTTGNPEGFCNVLAPSASAEANLLAQTKGVDTLDPAGNRFNFAPYNNLVDPLTRHSIAGMGHYDIFPGIEAFAAFHYTNVQDNNQLAPTPVTNLPAPLGFVVTPKAACAGIGTSPGNGVVGCDPSLTAAGAYNAFLLNPSAPGGIGTTAFITPTFQKDIDLRSVAINPATGKPFGYTPFAVRIRTLQLGPRIANFNTSSYQMTGGLRGTLPFVDGWDWEAYYDFGRSDFSQLQQHNVLQSHLNQALLGCPPGSANGCAPIDIFGAEQLNSWNLANGGVNFNAAQQLANPTQPQISNSAAHFIDYSTHTFNDFERQVFHFGTHGNIGNYWGAGPIGLAFGGEWRKDAGAFNPDAASQAFDIQGFTPALQTAGSYNVWEVFGEARVPILSDMPFAEYVGLDAGVRFSRYSNAGDATTWKIGGEWQPFDDIRFRAMWQRALRAPNINDLFNGGTQGFPAIADPCAGAKNGALNAAFCTAQFAAAGSAPFVAPYAQVNGQSEAITYGNPTLKPETSNSMIVGAVMTPTFLPDVTASLDFWRISIDKFIGPTGVGVVEAQCHAAFNAVGAAAFVPFATLGQVTGASPCAFVTRQADGELIFNVPSINQPGTLATSGLDLQVSAQHEVSDLLGESGDWGALDLNLAVEWLTEFRSNSGTSFKGQIDISSPAVFSTADMRPNYRFTTRLGYTYGDWRGVLTWEEIGTVVDNATGFGVNVRPYDKVDLAIKWNITDQYSADFIVNNLFNVDPPLGPYSLAAGINTFAETYDVLGTQMFIGLTAKL